MWYTEQVAVFSTATDESYWGDSSAQWVMKRQSHLFAINVPRQSRFGCSSSADGTYTVLPLSYFTVCYGWMVWSREMIFAKLKIGQISLESALQSVVLLLSSCRYSNTEEQEISWSIRVMSSLSQVRRQEKSSFPQLHIFLQPTWMKSTRFSWLSDQVWCVWVWWQ